MQHAVEPKHLAHKLLFARNALASTVLKELLDRSLVECTRSIHPIHEGRHVFDVCHVAVLLDCEWLKLRTMRLTLLLLLMFATQVLVLTAMLVQRLLLLFIMSMTSAAMKVLEAPSPHSMLLLAWLLVAVVLLLTTAASVALVTSQRVPSIVTTAIRCASIGCFFAPKYFAPLSSVAKRNVLRQATFSDANNVARRARKRTAAGCCCRRRCCCCCCCSCCS
jgi:hypothetical protein